jgi:hypothetical protein
MTWGYSFSKISEKKQKSKRGTRFGSLTKFNPNHHSVTLLKKGIQEGEYIKPAGYKIAKRSI